jgi:hypothetical protein
MKLWLQSTREGKEGLRFEVLKYDLDTKRGTVIGEMGVEFDTDLSKEALTKWGYKVVKGE